MGDNTLAYTFTHRITCGAVHTLLIVATLGGIYSANKHRLLCATSSVECFDLPRQAVKVVPKGLSEFQHTARPARHDTADLPKKMAQWKTYVFTHGKTPSPARQNGEVVLQTTRPSRNYATHFHENILQRLRHLNNRHLFGKSSARAVVPHPPVTHVSPPKKHTSCRDRQAGRDIDPHENTTDSCFSTTSVFLR